ANDSVLRRLNKTQTVDIKYNEDLHIQQWELHPRNNYIHAIILCLSGISVWRKKLLRSNNSFNKIMTKDRITKNDIDVIKNYLDVEKLLQNNENESKKIICLLRHIVHPMINTLTSTRIEGICYFECTTCVQTFKTNAIYDAIQLQNKKHTMDVVDELYDFFNATQSEKKCPECNTR
ncbi:unnamed protein product, partial [Didymodactylos carnosus]